MDLDQIRTTAIIAICSDDYLFDRLVLKGGNALRLVYGISHRTSLDLDFSMESDFEDLGEAEKHLLSALEKNFSLLDLCLFDSKFYPKPKTSENEWWGGYCVEFKLIDRQKSESLSGNLEQMRRESLSVDYDGQSSRRFTIDISKHEFVGGKEQSKIEGYICYVYSPSMIAAEKLRAICQQMPEYEFVKGKKRRARDFYDLFAILEKTAVDFSAPEFQEIISKVFDIKKVPIGLLGRISLPEIREYHETDWISVQDSLGDKSRNFEFYYNYVCSKLERLESLWIE